MGDLERGCVGKGIIVASDSLVRRVGEGLGVGVVAGELVQGRLEQREHVTFLEFAPLHQEREVSFGSVIC
jgi:hypothetical protein